jgi:hypothetical protein
VPLSVVEAGEEVSEGARTVDVETLVAEGVPVSAEVLEVSGEMEAVDVGASGTARDVALIVAGVEVEETNGGAFSMYEPSCWTA